MNFYIAGPKLFEGDIIYTDEIHKMMNGEAVFDAAYNKQWRNNVFPYTFARGMLFVPLSHIK